MEDKLIDIPSILNLFKRKFWIIILITSVTTGIAYYEASSMMPSYSTSLRLFNYATDEFLWKKHKYIKGNDND